LKVKYIKDYKLVITAWITEVLCLHSYSTSRYLLLKYAEFYTVYKYMHRYMCASDSSGNAS